MSAFSRLDSLLVWQEITRSYKLSTKKGWHHIPAWSGYAAGKFQVIALDLAGVKMLHALTGSPFPQSECSPAQILILEMFEIPWTQVLRWSELHPPASEEKTLPAAPPRATLPQFCS